MPRMEIESFEKGTRVRVVGVKQLVVVKNKDGAEEEKEEMRCLGHKAHSWAIGQEGTVEWTYASDVDGSPWVWVTLDGERRRRPGERALAFRPDDLEVLERALKTEAQAAEVVTA